MRQSHVRLWYTKLSKTFNWIIHIVISWSPSFIFLCVSLTIIALTWKQISCFRVKTRFNFLVSRHPLLDSMPKSQYQPQLRAQILVLWHKPQPKSTALIKRCSMISHATKHRSSVPLGPLPHYVLTILSTHNFPRGIRYRWPSDAFATI